MQGFEEVNGTSQVPNSDIPSWVLDNARAKSAAHAPAPSVDVDNKFVIPVKRNDVAGASSLGSGEQTCERPAAQPALVLGCCGPRTDVMQD